MYVVTKMTPEDAAAISLWTYPDEYAVYSFEPQPELTRELLGGEYFACREDGALAGYFCFGAAARIPTREPDAYEGAFTDIGLGMAPDRCGRGLGTDFLRAGLDFAASRLGASALRLTVAEFNLRAIRVYGRCGFARAGLVTHAGTGGGFLLMTKE